MRRWQNLPREVADSLALERRERVLASSSDVSGKWVVASNLALYLPDSDASTSHRIAWEDVERAEWDRDAEVLRVTETAPLGERTPHWVVRFDPPDARFLALLRERISATVVLEQHVRLRGRSGVRVIARRRAGGTGDLLWALAFDEEVDPHDPEIRAGAERALAAARIEVEP